MDTKGKKVGFTHLEHETLVNNLTKLFSNRMETLIKFACVGKKGIYDADGI